MEGLTEQQRRFVEAYIGPARGSAIDAARMAGYANPEKHAHRLVANGGIKAAILAANAKVRKAAIMTAEQRQAWLTRVVNGEVMDTAIIEGAPVEVPPRLKERLIACDQLSKMQGSYTEKHDVNVSGGLVVYLPTEGR